METVELASAQAAVERLQKFLDRQHGAVSQFTVDLKTVLGATRAHIVSEMTEKIGTDE